MDLVQKKERKNEKDMVKNKTRLSLCLLTILSIFIINTSTSAFCVPTIKNTVNINTASLEEMREIGIKKSVALRIIGFRKFAGPLKSKEDLLNIKGIGKKSLDKFIKNIDFGDKKSVKLFETSMTLEDIIKNGKLFNYIKDFKVDINISSPDELCMLPGIKEGTAKRIIKFRVKNGPFKKIEDLKKVRGIGNSKFEKLRNFITVGDGKNIKSLKDFEDADIKSLISNTHKKTKKATLGDGKLHIDMIDVGQGDSILIITPIGYTLLIDGGESYFGRKRVLPFLKKMGIDRINHLILSHSHIDHLGGVIPILKKIKVDNIYDSGFPATPITYRKFLRLVKRLGIDYHLGRDQTTIEGCGVKLYFLHPDKNILAYGTRSDPNNNSSVLKLEYNKFSMLFTGDIEADSERRLVKLHKKEINSTILKAPHHGGGFSSTMPFLRGVSPEVVLISVGYHNMFGHPSPKSLKKYKKIGAKVYRTDQSGTISITSDGLTYTIAEEFPNGSKSHKNIKSKESKFTKVVNINAASAKELQTIPLIGIKTAEKIINYREKHGPFKTISDITKVRGIGKKLFNKIKKYIGVE